MNKITKCRSCQSESLIDLLSLGDQYLSDFRKDKILPPKFPIDLVLCSNCYLVQLGQTTPPGLMYGDNYGFKSGINNTIKADLADIVKKAIERRSLKHGDFVIDIGCNDGTLLSNYPNRNKLHILGVDPVKKFKQESIKYADVIIDDYFSGATALSYLRSSKAAIITSISMFYDLDDPNTFVNGITDVLDQNGIWVIQQNYLMSMLKQNAYDNCVHEHIEYYSLLSLSKLLERHGLEVFDVEENSINGGSFRTYVAFKGKRKIQDSVVNLVKREIEVGLTTTIPYSNFAQRIKILADGLHDLVENIVEEGKRVYVYGASTRGNTLLQYSRLDNTLITAAVERNPEKYGKKISSLQIPIISEAKARKDKPDYALLLPWFFAKEIVARDRKLLEEGMKFIIPLPTIDIWDYDRLKAYENISNLANY